MRRCPPVRPDNFSHANEYSRAAGKSRESLATTIEPAPPIATLRNPYSDSKARGPALDSPARDLGSTQFLAEAPFPRPLAFHDRAAPTLSLRRPRRIGRCSIRSPF